MRENITIFGLLSLANLAQNDKWIKKMWYLYTTEFYSAMKKNEILSFASKWMELERLARLRRPKIMHSPSYADFRSRANTAM
jgi:hypothetical protein